MTIELMKFLNRMLGMKSAEVLTLCEISEISSMMYKERKFCVSAHREKEKKDNVGCVITNKVISCL